MYSFSRVGIVGVIFYFGLTSALSAADGNPFATTFSSANTNDFSFLNTGCVIPVNQNVCQPAYKAPFKNSYGVDISIRSDLMDSIQDQQSGGNPTPDEFRGGIKIPASFDYTASYNIGNSFPGGSITLGTHTMKARKPDGTVLATGTATVTCAPGTTWQKKDPSYSGKFYYDYQCTADTPAGQSATPSQFSVADCVIKKGDSSCDTTFTVKTYANRIMQMYYQNMEAGWQNDWNNNGNDKYKVLWSFYDADYDGAGTYKANVRLDGWTTLRSPNLGYYHPENKGLTYGLNTIELRESGKVIATTTARATCAPGTIWTVFGQIDGKGQSPNNNMRGTRYCLPPFPDTPSGATGIQIRKINAEEPRLDPEFGNIEGYCDPGYKWLPEKPYTYQGKTYTYYSCKISDQTVSASDVKFTVQPCVIGAENDPNSGGNVCNALVTLDTKVNAMFSIVNTFGKDAPDVNGMIQYPFAFNNFTERNYNTYGDGKPRRVQLQYGENTIQLRSMKQMPTALENKYIGDIVTTVKITVGCAQGTRYDKVRKMCLKNDQTLAIGEDKNPEFISALMINGQDGKSKSISVVSNPGSSPSISGKIEFPTRKNYSVVGAPAINVYPLYVQAMDEGKLSVKITSDSTENYIIIPVKNDGTFNIANSTTPVNYRNAFFSSGESTLKFELIQKDGLNYADGKGGITTVDSTLSALIVNIQVSIVNSTLPADATPVPITGPISVASGATIPARTNTTTTDTDSAIVVIRDTLSPDTSSLDAASKARIDKIIARVDKRVSAMIVENALKYLDASIARIKALPNKNAKAKLIDTYTIEKLEDLRDTIAETETDYIGLIDTSLSDN